MQSKDDLAIENANINLFRKNMVSGIFASVSIETEDLSNYERMLSQKIPVVFFDRVVELKGCTKVCLADEAAAQIAHEAIIIKKKKKVLALFGHPHLSITQKRARSLKNTFYSLAPKTELRIAYPETVTESKSVALTMLWIPGISPILFLHGRYDPDWSNVCGAPIGIKSAGGYSSDRD